MVFVVGNTGIRLMPTSEYRARKLMSRNRAVVYKHRPFTIQLLDCKSGGKQPVEYTSDVGSYEAGISVKSEKLFFVKYFSLKKASEFPFFSKGFSLPSAGIMYPCA